MLISVDESTLKRITINSINSLIENFNVIDLLNSLIFFYNIDYKRNKIETFNKICFDVVAKFEFRYEIEIAIFAKMTI